MSWLHFFYTFSADVSFSALSYILIHFNFSVTHCHWYDFLVIAHSFTFFILSDDFSTFANDMYNFALYI